MTNIREFRPEGIQSITFPTGLTAPAISYSERGKSIMHLYGGRDEDTLSLHPIPEGDDQLKRSEVIFNGLLSIMEMPLLPFDYKNSLAKVACDMVEGGVLTEHQLIALIDTRNNALNITRGETKYHEE